MLSGSRKEVDHGDLASQRGLVLVVDDDPSWRKLARIAVERQHFTGIMC